MNPVLQFEKCYLETIRIVSTHDIKSDLIFSFGAYFKKLAKDINGKLINNQLPQNSPPEAPLVIIKSKDFNISFSQSQVQIEVSNERKHTRLELLHNISKTKISKAKEIIKNYYDQGNFKQGFIGIIGPIRFPQLMAIKKEEIIQKLSEAFSERITSDELVNFNTKMGYLNKKQNLYENYEIQDYEVKNIQIDQKKAQTRVIDLNEFPTVEKGVLINIDVNNRPRNHLKDRMEEFDDLVNSFFHFIENNKILNLFEQL